MPIRRRPKGPRGGQFAPGERCEQIEPDDPLKLQESSAVSAVDSYDEPLVDTLTRIEAKRLMENSDLDHESVWDEAQRATAVRVAIEPAHVTNADLQAHEDMELPEWPQGRHSLQEWTDSQEEASRLSAEFYRVLREEFSAGNTQADNPKIVAAREAALNATNKEIRLRQKYLGSERTQSIPSTVCRNCGMTIDQDRSMPGKVAGYSDPQDRCPVCARYLDGYKYPASSVDF